MATALDLFRVLREKSGFEMVKHNPSTTRLRILGRIPHVGMNLGNWRVLMDRLLGAMEMGRPWSVDISRWYFKKAGKTVYAWRLIFQAEELDKQFADVINIIKTSPGSMAPEPTEVPLFGRGNNDTSGGHRGAGSYGSVAVGPMAVMRKNMGG